MSELLRQPETDLALALVERLKWETLAFEAKHHPRKQKWRQKDLETLRTSIGALVADLLLHASNEASAGFMYRSTQRSQFTETYCSSRHYEFLLSMWPEMEWVQLVKGFQKNDDFDGKSIREFGKAGRLRATPVLIDLCKESGIVLEAAEEHFPKDHSKSKPIQVTARKVTSRSGKKTSSNMKPPANAKLEILTKQVSDLNAYLEKHQFSLAHTPQFKRTFHNGDDFNFDYDQGGRLYCISEDNYQSMPQSERVDILIDHEPCVEVDVNSSFLLIFHWLCGAKFDVTSDPYIIDGIERMVTKKLLVSRFGSEGWPSRWPRGFKDEYSSATGRDLTKKYKLKETVDQIQTALPILSKVDQSKNGWAQLQYWESEAVFGAMQNLKNELDIVTLPIHDSLLGQRKNTHAISVALQQSYMGLFGMFPGLKMHFPEA